MTTNKICLLVLFAVVAAKGDDSNQGWMGDLYTLTGDDTPSTEPWVGESSDTPQYAPSPVSDDPQPWQEELIADSAGHPITVMPGPRSWPPSNDQRVQETMFFPKKEQEYKEYDKVNRQGGVQQVTKWGNTDSAQDDSGHHGTRFSDHNDDNDRAHKEPIYYAYEYKVHDPKTGDVKGHKESRDGDRVKGYYMLHDADGSMREVHYTADHDVGFTAVVSKTDDVAPPHKSIAHHDEGIFGHNVPKHSVSTFHGNNDKHQSYSSTVHHGKTKEKPSFHSLSFHDKSKDTTPKPHHFPNVHNDHESDRPSHFHESDRPSHFHVESDEEARHVEHFRPTPTYEDAYNNFAKKQPMPVLSDEQHGTRSHHHDEHDDEHDDDDEDSFFKDEDREEFDSFDSKSFFQNHDSKDSSDGPHYRHQPRHKSSHPVAPFHLSTHRRPRMHDPELKSKERDSFRQNGSNLSIKHRNNAHSFQFHDTKPTYQTYEEENEKDYENDESRATISILPTANSGHHVNTNGNIRVNPFALTNNNGGRSQPSIVNPASPLIFSPYPETSFDHDDGTNKETFKNRIPFMGNFNVQNTRSPNQEFEGNYRNPDVVDSSYLPQTQRNSGPRKGNAEKHRHNRPKNNPAFSSLTNVEGGFKPIPNPYQFKSSDNSYRGSYENVPAPKREPFRHSTSLSPDNSRFRSFKNHSYPELIGNPEFENTPFPKRKLKKGFFENSEHNKRPNPNHDSRWVNDQFKSEYFDDFNGEGPMKPGFQKHPKGHEIGKHSVPKRETVKYRIENPKGNYQGKVNLRLANKKPKIHSIYDVMAYGGSDWPKKIRSSYLNKKKARKVMRGFSNRRYNEAKKKRSIHPQDGYFPDRTTLEQNINRPQPSPSLDYEYMSNY